ncbi:50S ribosomal protein L31 [Candidatus Dojkabacteria bacterium]|uniref:50S ribosomal protein L31 n=1 Tax=Candidatus Dojkabacteria bacterium TaxID=2099670 RepID=A0A955HYB8_9BACT|nr:50S ribosomal protein L31 [Candidatus Dojkabacteria bacterium]MCB9790631.1 50S ribosomal protein L31 [Candidatus Nomurabacteria bacterium]
MKKGIHPKYSNNVKVTCSCGNVFYIGSTSDGDIVTELCSKCHPFFTGAQKLVDSQGMIDKYLKQVEKKKSTSSFRSKREKEMARRAKQLAAKSNKTPQTKGLTLKDMIKQLDK